MRQAASSMRQPLCALTPLGKEEGREARGVAEAFFSCSTGLPYHALPGGHAEHS